MADVHLTILQPMTCSRFGSQVLFRQEAECLSPICVERHGKRLTPRRRWLQCPSSGSPKPNAFYICRERDSRRGFHHSSCVNSSLVVVCRPRLCTPCDETPPLHTQPDSSGRAQPFRSENSLMDPRSVKGMRQSRPSALTGTSSEKERRRGSGRRECVGTS